MNRAATIAWLGKWSALYDTSYDKEVGSKYRGRRALGLDELEVIYGWKYRGLWPAKKIRALRAHVTDRQARDWTWRAFACPDNLGALCIAGTLAGAGPGGASTVLTAVDPIRFTVMDARAIKSPAFLGRWSIDARVQSRPIGTGSTISMNAGDWPSCPTWVSEGPFVRCTKPPGCVDAQLWRTCGPLPIP